MTPKNHKIVFRQKALIMLREHIQFLARVNTTAAKTLRNDIETTANSLSEFPERGTVRSGSADKYSYRQLLVAHRYLVIYYVENDTVYIDRVLDCRQANTD